MVLKLVISEIHIPDLHGFMENSSEQIFMNYIVTSIIELDDFYSYDYLDEIAIINECYDMWLIDNIRSLTINENISINVYGIHHPYIRNYVNIITNDDYIKVDIADVEELEGGEIVAYHKTFWLRIIQRKWKKIYKERREIIEKRKRAKTLNMRSLYGKWPKGLCNIPKLCGMLNNL